MYLDVSPGTVVWRHLALTRMIRRLTQAAVWGKRVREAWRWACRLFGLFGAPGSRVPGAARRARTRARDSAPLRQAPMPPRYGTPPVFWTGSLFFCFEETVCFWMSSLSWSLPAPRDYAIPSCRKETPRRRRLRGRLGPERESMRMSECGQIERGRKIV